MRHKRLIALMLLLALLGTAGCWDASSPEQYAWVSTIGVDEAPNGTFFFTFQTIIPRVAATSSTGGARPGGARGQSAVVFTVQAPDVVTAVEMSDAFVARRVNLQHAKAMIIGESVARKGVEKVLAPAIRYREFRRTMYVMVARGSAREFVESIKPRMETDPAFWFEMLMAWQRETMLVPPARIHDFVLGVESPGLGSRAILVAARPDIESGQERLRTLPGTASGAPPSPAAVTAGDVARVGEIAVELAGVAVFKGDVMIGTLSAQESRVLAVLRGEMGKRTPATIPDPIVPSTRVVLLIQGNAHPQFRVSRSGSRVSVDIYVPMEGDLGSAPSMADFTNRQT